VFDVIGVLGSHLSGGCMVSTPCQPSVWVRRFLVFPRAILHRMHENGGFSWLSGVVEEDIGVVWRLNFVR